MRDVTSEVPPSGCIFNHSSWSNWWSLLQLFGFIEQTQYLCIVHKFSSELWGRGLWEGQSRCSIWANLILSETNSDEWLRFPVWETVTFNSTLKNCWIWIKNLARPKAHLHDWLVLLSSVVESENCAAVIARKMSAKDLGETDFSFRRRFSTGAGVISALSRLSGWISGVRARVARTLGF